MTGIIMDGICAGKAMGGLLDMLRQLNYQSNIIV